MPHHTASKSYGNRRIRSATSETKSVSIFVVAVEFAPRPLLLTNLKNCSQLFRSATSYNGQSLRNGLPSATRSKYSSVDQSAPVNLAVSQDAGAGAADALALSHKMNDVAALTKPSALESEQDAISSSIANLYQHKLSYCQPETSTSLYYPSFYPSRAPTNYG